MNTTGRTLLLALAAVAAINHTAHGAESSPASAPALRSAATLDQARNTMKIRLTVNGKALTASLNDSAISRDFVSLLPMTLTLEDYAKTEKISYLSRKLSTAGAPAGSDPAVGDITYYAPWGNLAIFYKDFGYSTGLIKLGRIDSGVEALSVSGSMKVTIERLEQ